MTLQTKDCPWWAQFFKEMKRWRGLVPWLLESYHCSPCCTCTFTGTNNLKYYWINFIFSPTHFPISEDTLSFTIAYLSQVPCCQSCRHKHLPNLLYDFQQPHIKLFTIHFQGSGWTPPLFSYCLATVLLNEYHFKNQAFLGTRPYERERAKATTRLWTQLFPL